MNSAEKSLWSTALIAQLTRSTNLNAPGVSDLIDAANWATDVLDTLARIQALGDRAYSRGLTARAKERLDAILGEAGTTTAQTGAGAGDFDPELVDDVHCVLSKESGGTWGFTVSIGKKLIYDYGQYANKSEAEKDMWRYRKMADQICARGAISEIEDSRKRTHEKLAAAEKERAKPVDTKVTISGSRLEFARKMSEMTLPSAAKALGYQPAFLKSYEIGEPDIELAELKNLCDLYGVSEAYLTDLEPATIQAYQTDKRTSRR